jgi:hypothetical protein
LAKDKRFYAVGVKSGKDAKKAIAMALRDIERGVGRAKVGAEEINGIF